MPIRKILALDAATCALMGLLLISATSYLSNLLGMPAQLLNYAGLLLLPIALFMAIVAWQTVPSAAGIWLIIVGNAAWVVASLVVLVFFDSNALGVAFVLSQAAVVAVLMSAEFSNRPGLSVRSA
jgi:hypothetical protein